MRDNQKVAELEDAIIQLYSAQITTQTADMALKDKKLLQAVFGDGFLIQNHMRTQLVSLTKIVKYLLLDIIVKMFVFHQGQQRSLTNVSQMNIVNQSKLSGDANTSQLAGVRQMQIDD